MAEGTCALNVTPEIMSQIATFDVDGDQASLFGLKRSWKHVVKTLMKVKSVKEDVLVLHGEPTDKPDTAYAVVGTWFKKFEVCYSKQVPQNVCWISETA